MEKKDFAIIKGILLHPFKMLCFKLNKERERALYMSSLTNTPFIF